VLLSGLSRISIFFYMVTAFVAPLASSPGQLFQRSGKYGSGLKVGEFELMPGAIFSFLAVLVVGFIVLRLFRRWLRNTYLPNTNLETGMRSSLTTLLGYVGGIVVITLALSALGISVNRIAWIASALSVGIGFGLQAIVQNFISGLILLAERPVKVGDWVVLGASEGDVRRINVRATEIQLGDRSTLIVPNSEFITKTVRNMTLRNSEGRVLIRLPMPLTTDARQVRDIMLGTFQEHEAVLPEPAPSVTLDGIENGLLIFQAIAYVPGPRMAAGVRSEVLFTILERLQAAQVPMAGSAAASVPGATGPSLAPAATTAPAGNSHRLTCRHTRVRKKRKRAISPGDGTSGALRVRSMPTTISRPGREDRSDPAGRLFLCIPTERPPAYPAIAGSRAMPSRQRHDHTHLLLRAARSERWLDVEADRIW
jgi:small-conductance mechanosensitive channel